MQKRPLEDNPRMRENESVDQLIAFLKAHDGHESLDGEYALKVYGSKAVPAVLAVLSELNDCGQADALDFLAACPANDLMSFQDPTVAEMVEPLLRTPTSFNCCVAVQLLGHLQATQAIPRLLKLYEEAKTEGPESALNYQLRATLAMLGVRKRVIPARVKELDRRGDNSLFAFDDLVEIVNLLADADQVVLPFQLWGPLPRLPRFGRDPSGAKRLVDRLKIWWRNVDHREDRGKLYELGAARYGTPLELEGDWKAVVANCRNEALRIGRLFDDLPPGVFFSLDWLDESDR